MHLQATDLVSSLLTAMKECERDPQSLLAFAAALDVVRRMCLQSITARLGQPEKPSQPAFISVGEAHSRYPVSRSFLYERGEAEGIVSRPTGKKVVVNVRALEKWLGQRRG